MVSLEGESPTPSESGDWRVRVPAVQYQCECTFYSIYYYSIHIIRTSKSTCVLVILSFSYADTLTYILIRILLISDILNTHTDTAVFK